MKIIAYTDGACSGNHDKKITSHGGYGVVLQCLDSDGNIRKERHLAGYVESATNNHMELLAAIKALYAIDAGTEVTVYSDSKYVVQGITEWIINWKKKGWKGSNKKPVANKELWVELDMLNNANTVNWVWLKGHDGHPKQELADDLAVEASLSKEDTDRIFDDKRG